MVTSRRRGTRASSGRSEPGALVVRQVVDQNPIVPPLMPYANFGFEVRLYNYEQDELADPALIPDSAKSAGLHRPELGAGRCDWQLSVEPGHASRLVGDWSANDRTRSQLLDRPIGLEPVLCRYARRIGQAREAIAIWLAASATPATRAAAMACGQGLGIIKRARR